MKNGFLKRVGMVILAVAISSGSVAFAETNFNKNFKEADRAFDRQRPRKYAGTPSTDYANIMIGVFNVTPIFGTFHENEVTRDLNTRICAEMGVSTLSSGRDSAGEYCCKLWETDGNTLPGNERDGMNKKMGGFFAGRDEKKRDRLKYRNDRTDKSRDGFIDYCCRMVDKTFESNEQLFCKTVAHEKSECVNGELKKNGQDMEAALSACELSCDIKQYGALKHNEDGEYNKEEVDGMVKTCAMEDVDWAPSTTVPGPEAFIPAVPTNVGNILGGENGEGDGSGKAHTLAATVRSITVVDPNRSKGAGDCKDGKSCSYLNNEDSAMENRNKLRLNAAAQGIVLGQQAVALATESGKDVDDLRKEIEYRDDVLRMLKGIAKLQAQHLQKTNAITAMRAKLVELSAIGNIASGSIYTTKSSKK